MVKLHVGVILAEIPPYFDRERVGEGAKPLVLVCMVSKTMCGYDRCVAPSAQLQVNRQYLRGYLIFLNQSLLGKVLPKLSQRSPSARAKRGMWDGEKRVERICFYKIHANTY
ncbi:hypothetical protein DKE47_021930 (plasmid) [Acinetobacter nosocomialis]|nr:hypothetical protein DKE47_021930 [Acinetobacter nosocomialis]